MVTKLTEEDIHNIIEKYQSGVTFYKLMREYKIGKNKLNSILKEVKEVKLSKREILSKIIETELIGKKFGTLTVINIDKFIYKDRSIRVICLCECGKTISVPASKLKSGHIKSCGCSRYLLLEQNDYRLSSIKRDITRYIAKENEDMYWHYAKLLLSDCKYCGSIPSILTNYFDNKTTRQKQNFTDKYREVKDKFYDSAFVYRNGIDRVDSSIKEHTLGNLVPCCPTCNTMKLDLSLDDFLQHLFLLSANMFNFDISTEQLKNNILIIKQNINQLLEDQLKPDFSSKEEVMNMLDAQKIRLLK